MQTALIDQLFKSFLDLFAVTFADCERAFVNKIVVSLHYKSYYHDQYIKRGNKCYFITKGGFTVCETSCYNEPIVVYGPGASILLYQVMFPSNLKFEYRAVSSRY